MELIKLLGSDAIASLSTVVHNTVVHNTAQVALFVQITTNTSSSVARNFCIVFYLLSKLQV